MKEKPAPQKAYIFVCTNDDCCDSGSKKVLKKLKKCVEERGLKKRVRVAECGCLGQCDDGPNVLLEPGQILCSKAGKGDVETIVSSAQAIAEGKTKAGV